MPPSPPKTTANTGEAVPPPSTQKGVQNRSVEEGNSNSNLSGDNNGVLGDGNLGSGLATFFGDFVPYQRDTMDQPIGFSTGLSRLPAPTIENANHIEQTIGIKYVDGGLLYSQWRNKEKEYLTDYLMQRLHPHPDNEETAATQSSGGDNSNASYSESSEDNAGEEELEPETQPVMETQEPLLAEKLQPTNHQEKSSGKKSKKRPRRNIIPYVEDCLHDLTKLEFLDLHARTLSLNLSRIDKVWRLRDTKRSGALGKGSIRKPVFERCATAPPSRSRRLHLPRLVFEEKEEDGPVATIYKKVIHLEVQQLPVKQAGGLGRTQSPQRIKVFFYNSYATAVSEWITEQQKQSGTKRKRNNSTGTTDMTTDVTTATTDIVMSLSNIPASCIFPYSIDPRNWREKQDLVEYCLCIGDRSIAMTRRSQQHGNHDTENQIRFDSSAMEIRLMAVVTKTTTSRSNTAAGSIVTTDVVDDVNVSSELVLSRRTLAKKFLSSSSSEDITPEMVEGGEEKDLEKGSEETISTLQNSWKSYKKNQGQNIASQTLNERPPLPQPNQRGLQQIQGGPPTNEQQSKVPRNDDDKPVSVEPMVVEGSTQRRSDSKAVHYVRLGEIDTMVDQSISAGKGWNFKVNLYASVVSVTPPRITKRGDWMIAVTLIDESCLKPMTINIFCRKQDHLPKLIWMGDVIRIHRASIDKWYDKLQLQGLMPTQYVVIRKTGQNWQVIPTSKNYFTFNTSDEVRSQELWHWANSHAEKSPTMKPELCFNLEQLQHLKKEDDETTFANRDITVMVVQKLRYQSSNIHPHGLLRVWDGTGNPPSDPLFMPAKVLNPSPGEHRAAAYPRAVQKVIRASQQLQASIETMETPLSLCGRISNVVVWEKSHWDVIDKHIQVGTFLRLRNVHIPHRWENNNFRSIFMHDKSWMTALPTGNFEVRSLLYHHNERVRTGGSNTYNPEFGGSTAVLPDLPTYSFVGKGLSLFRNQETAKVYTGAAHVLLCKASSRPQTNGTENGTITLVTIADRSGSFQAMATKKIHQELQNWMPEDSFSSSTPGAKSLDMNRRFLVTIRMFILDGEERKHFVLTNLAPMD